MTVENLHLLAADLNEPCPWDAHERGSLIFAWSAFSMVNDFLSFFPPEIVFDYDVY